ncbi:exonuclease [Sulfolobus sp. A20-N-F8]|nr:exonuclease [Sulfolobus sp. A20-N-F8]
MKELYLGLHNITSTQRLIDFSRLAFSIPHIKYLIITKVGGTAAQSGIPEVSKIAFRQNKAVIVLPDLKDAIDLLQPDTTLLISQNAEKTLDFTEIYNYGKIFVVFPGIDNNGFSKIDQSLGNYVKMLDNASDLGPVSLASFFLCKYLNLVKS